MSKATHIGTHGQDHLVIAVMSAAFAAQGMAQVALASDSLRLWLGSLIPFGIAPIVAVTLALFPASYWFQHIGLEAWRAVFERGLFRSKSDALFGSAISFSSALVSAAAFLVFGHAAALTQRAVLQNVEPVATELVRLETDLTRMADGLTGLAASASDLATAEAAEGNTCEGKPTGKKDGPRARKRARDMDDLARMAATADRIAAEGTSIRLRMQTGTIEAAAPAIEQAQRLLRSADMNNLRRDLQRIRVELETSFVDPGTGKTYVCRTPAFEARLTQVADDLESISALSLPVPAPVAADQGWGFGMQAVIDDLHAWLFTGGPIATSGLYSLFFALFCEVVQVSLLARSVRRRHQLRLLPTEAETIEQVQEGRRTPDEAQNDRAMVDAVVRRLWRQRRTAYLVTSTRPDDVERKILAHFGLFPAMGAFHDVPINDLDPSWAETHSDLWEVGTRFDVYPLPRVAFQAFWLRKSAA